MSIAPNISPVLRLDGVSYTYPRSGAGVFEISLEATPGTVYGLLGVNGAGKTTLMRLMIGLLTPSAGNIWYLGSELAVDWQRKLRSIGTLIETPSLYFHLTGRQHLHVFAHYSGAPSEAVERTLELTGLEGAADKTVRDYSLGMKQRLGLATALLHDPPLLILDEPTNGLDPSGIADVRGLLKRLKEAGKTMIVSSHLLAEVEKSATRVGILHEGRLRFEGTPNELSAHVRVGSGVLIRTSAPEDAARLLASSGWTFDLREDGVFVTALTEQDRARAVRELVSGGIDVHETVREVGSLEEDFLSLIGSEKDAG